MPESSPSSILLLAILSTVLFFAPACSLWTMPEVHVPLEPDEFMVPLDEGRLRADVDFMMRTLENVHPQLYANIDRKQAASLVEEFEEDLRAPMTRVAFYKDLSKLVARFGDGHTFVYYPDDEYEHYARKGGLLFPFGVEIRSGRIFIRSVYDAAIQAAPGSEILEIEGIPANRLVREMTERMSMKREPAREAFLAGLFHVAMWLEFPGKAWYDHHPCVGPALVEHVVPVSRHQSHTAGAFDTVVKPSKKYCTHTTSGEPSASDPFRVNVGTGAEIVEGTAVLRKEYPGPGGSRVE